MKILDSLKKSSKENLSFIVSSNKGDKNEINKAIGALRFMAKGILFIAACTSLSYIIPSIYSLSYPLGVWPAVGITSLTAIFFMILIDICMGIIAPFTSKYIISGAAFRSSYGMLAALMLSGIVLAQVSISILFTYHGSETPVTASVGHKSDLDLHDPMILANQEKQIKKEVHERYKPLIADALASEKEAKSLINQKAALNVKEVERRWAKHADYIAAYPNSQRANEKAKELSKIEEKRIASISKVKSNVQELMRREDREVMESVGILSEAKSHRRDMNSDKTTNHAKTKANIMFILRTMGTASSILFLLITILISLIDIAKGSDHIYEDFFPSRREAPEAPTNRKVRVKLEGHSGTKNASELKRTFQSYRAKASTGIGNPNTNIENASKALAALQEVDMNEAEAFMKRELNTDPDFLKNVISR